MTMTMPDNDSSDEQNTNENAPANAALTAFDGLTLSNEENREILVNANGNFTLRENGVVVKSADHDNVSLDAKAFVIRDLNYCQVQVNGKYNSVHIINTKNTTLQIMPPIHGPVHVTNCHDTTVQIPFSRQLRIHDCTNVTFILHVASGPIIEGCKGMKFYQKDYKANAVLASRSPSKNKNAASVNVHKDKESEKSASFQAGINLYADVKDFHWLKNNVKSPNFDVYTESEARSMRELADYFAVGLAITDAVGSMDNEDEDEGDDSDSSEDEL